MKFSCPICKKPVKLGDSDFPFCSERCRVQDLANWSTEKYKVASTDPPPEDEEDANNEG